MTEEGELIAGRYRLVSKVGAGAMGVVWQAHDERLHRTVAVKQLSLHSGMSEIEADEANRRAMREGRIAARLHHPHAITVYDVAEHEGKPCLIMEYLHSESLSTVLEIRGPLPAEEVAKIGSQLASALTAAHAAGIVHRDIKPGNVLLAEDGTAKITDFGISRAVGDGTLTGTGILAGTPAYLAPEIAQGHGVGFPADVFSLGATLYAAVEGVPPFGLDDNALALLYRIATSEITAPRQSGPLTPVLARMLERDVSQRPTMGQAQEALAELATVDDLRPPPAPTLAPVLVPVLDPHPPAALPETGLSAGTDTPAPTAAPPSTQAPPPTHGGKPPPWRAAIIVVAVSLIAIGILFGTTLINDQRPTAGPISSPPNTTQDAAQSEQAPPPSSTIDSTIETTPNATPSPPTPSPPTNDAVPPDTPEQLQAAVSDYYALMPGNLEAGWTRLTADYQRNHAGGLSGYQAFWNAIQRVEISNISASRPARAAATITYFYRDGRVIEEQTSFGLVPEDGLWKIASSSVNSSRTTQG
ncbi:MAG: protein kinase domain-containing protein [Pseudonocardiales bacterium]